MNRELIFMQWDNRKHTWLYHDLDTLDTYIFEYGNKKILETGACNIEQYVKVYTPIMQFTGLRDCNGKMIFDGDVVKIDSIITGKTHICCVIWSVEYLCFIGYEEGIGSESFHHYLGVDNIIAIQVIGNAHE